MYIIVETSHSITDLQIMLNNTSRRHYIIYMIINSEHITTLRDSVLWEAFEKERSHQQGSNFKSCVIWLVHLTIFWLSWPSLALAQSLRRWASINPALVQRFVYWLIKAPCIITEIAFLCNRPTSASSHNILPNQERIITRSVIISRGSKPGMYPKSR